MDKKKSIIFFSLITFFIALINSPYLEKLLAWILGIETAAGIAVLFKNQTQGLIITALLAFYINYIQYKKPSLVFTDKMVKMNDGFTEIISKFPSKDIISLVLKNYYSTSDSNKNVKNLVEQVLSDKPHYYDSKVRMKIYDSKSNSDWYCYKYDIEFSANINEFVIAFVSDCELQNKLSNMCPLVCDVVTITDSKAQDYNLEFLRSKISVSQLTEDNHGYSVKTELVLKKVGVRASKKYLEGLSNEEIKEVVLLRASLINSKSGLNKLYVSTQEFEMKKSGRYIYWVSDRTMWVESIEIDTSGFTYNENVKFNLQTFMVNYRGSDNLENQDKLFKIFINDWVGNCSGLILNWK